MSETAAERYERELAQGDATGCGSPNPTQAERHHLAAIEAAERAFGPTALPSTEGSGC